jgi:hypothetical protein
MKKKSEISFSALKNIYPVPIVMKRFMCLPRLPDLADFLHGRHTLRILNDRNTPACSKCWREVPPILLYTHHFSLLQNVVLSTASKLVVLVKYILYVMVLMLQRTMTNCTSGTTTTWSSSSASSSAKQQPYDDDHHHPDWNNQHPSTTTTTAAAATSPHHNISFSMMILFAMNTIWLIYFHVSMNLLPNNILTYDDASTTTSTTIWYHPLYDSVQNMWWWRHVTAMDMILFTSLVVMAFELLDCMTKLSASTLLFVVVVCCFIYICVCDDDDGCCYWLYTVGSLFRCWRLLLFLVTKRVSRDTTNTSPWETLGYVTYD